MPVGRGIRIGIPLSQLRSELMAETFQSMTPAQTTSSTPFYNYQLARVQREQWNDTVWPYLTLYQDIPMVQGQRYYTYPPELPFDSVTRIWGPSGTNWVPLVYGINPTTYASMGGEFNQGYPPQRWRHYAAWTAATGITTPNGWFEIWPMPNAAVSNVRVEGQAPLNPLAADSDTCTLDATLLVMYAAAEILAVKKSEGAALKLQKANAYKRMLVARIGSQQRKLHELSRDGGYMGSLQGNDIRPTPYIDYVPPFG